MNGTYPVDIHHSQGGGITFRYLDGSERTVYGKGTRTESAAGASGSDTPASRRNTTSSRSTFSSAIAIQTSSRSVVCSTPT